MGSILSAINDDINEYEYLCTLFNEKPVKDHIGPNPYSDHARELKRRYREKWKKDKGRIE